MLGERLNVLLLQQLPLLVNHWRPRVHERLLLLGHSHILLRVLEILGVLSVHDWSRRARIAGLMRRGVWVLVSSTPVTTTPSSSPFRVTRQIEPSWLPEVSARAAT
jgi:hypothetical protein